MTDLMKRYEAETGKSSTQTITDGLDIWHYEYIAWLENQVLDGKTIEKFQEIIRTQCDEISALKAQLTWRDVSEPTWKADWFLVKENHKGTIMYDVGWSDGTTFGNPLVVGWLPIPPAQEEKV